MGGGGIGWGGGSEEVQIPAVLLQKDFTFVLPVQVTHRNKEGNNKYPSGFNNERNIRIEFDVGFELTERLTFPVFYSSYFSSWHFTLLGVNPLPWDFHRFTAITFVYLLIHVSALCSTTDTEHTAAIVAQTIISTHTQTQSRERITPCLILLHYTFALNWTCHLLFGLLMAVDSLRAIRVQDMLLEIKEDLESIASSCREKHPAEVNLLKKHTHTHTLAQPWPPG